MTDRMRDVKRHEFTKTLDRYSEYYLLESDVLTVLQRPCVWSPNAIGSSTACGNHDITKPNQYEFCPFCGGEITEDK